jgi:hypothetical protein
LSPIVFIGQFHALKREQSSLAIIFTRNSALQEKVSLACI